MEAVQGITILGSTGSIGTSTLSVIRQHPDKYRPVALTANRDVDGLLAQCKEFSPAYAVMADPTCAEQLAGKIKAANVPVTVLAGEESLQQVASLPEVDQVMAAIVGGAGLLPTLRAVESGKRVLLANKESLVMTGQLFMQAVESSSAQLLPIDSEHNAILQCLPDQFNGNLQNAGVEKILLTASGGPFRTTDINTFADITPEQAVAHPNWDMGKKISVDSATMMNKGLEVIEACWLFNATPEQVQVVIHPESVIHSMVQYNDGSVMAQLGMPDMRTPIAYGMGWPERIESGVERLDLFKIANLHFEIPDFQRFPCLKLAFDAIRAGGTMPAVLNAANEIAVQRFLDKDIRFDQIAMLIADVMSKLKVQDASSVEIVLQADQAARETAEHWAGK